MSSTKLNSTRISCFTFLAYKTTCNFRKKHIQISLSIFIFQTHQLGKLSKIFYYNRKRKYCHFGTPSPRHESSLSTTKPYNSRISYSFSFHTKGHATSEKLKIHSTFSFPKRTNFDKRTMQWLHYISKKNKPVPYQEQIAEKQNFKGQLIYFNHRISFVTKLLVSPFSEENSYIIF